MPGRTVPLRVTAAMMPTLRSTVPSDTPDELIVVVPLSSLLAPSALRIDVTPDAGIERPSRAVCRAVRAVVSSRFVRRIGSVDQATMEQVQMALALILELDRKLAPE